MQSNTSTTNPVLDALDCLNRSREILGFMLDMHTKDRDNDPGVGWILAEVQSGISDAMALLNAVPSARETAP